MRILPFSILVVLLIQWCGALLTNCANLELNSTATYTVTGDLDCRNQQIHLEISSGANVTLDITTPTIFGGVRFVVYAGSRLNFLGSNLSLVDSSAGEGKVPSASVGYGGALWNFGIVVSSVESLSFINNTAGVIRDGSNSGGSIYVGPGASLTVQSNTYFSSAFVSADNGAGLYTDGGVTFAGKSSWVGLKAFSQGGALFVSETGSVTFQGDTVFQGNSGVGGAICSKSSNGFNGGIFFEENATSTFSNNASGGSGGALLIYSGGAYFWAPATFENNTATIQGSALYVQSGTGVSFQYPTLFSGNNLTQGGVYIIAGDGYFQFCGLEGTDAMLISEAENVYFACDVGYVSTTASKTKTIITWVSVTAGVILICLTAAWCFRNRHIRNPWKRLRLFNSRFAGSDESMSNASATVLPRSALAVSTVSGKAKSPSKLGAGDRNGVSSALKATVNTDRKPLSNSTKSEQSKQQNEDVDDENLQRSNMVEGAFLAWQGLGAVASNVPWIRYIYGLCDEIVQLLDANESAARNCKEVVAWMRQMQTTLNNVEETIQTCADPSINVALIERCSRVLVHVRVTIEQHASRNMVAQFLLSKKLQLDLQEAGKWFIDAIQSLQLGVSAQQLKITTDLLSTTMRIDDGLSDIMSAVKNNEVLLTKLIQLAGFSANSENLSESTSDEAFTVSTVTITPIQSLSECSEQSPPSASALCVQDMSNDLVLSLKNNKVSKSVPLEAVLEALERLHIAPSALVRLESTPIGQGGFSKVYRVKLGERIVAAKVVDLGALSPHHLQSVYRRFAREIYILSLLSSPYVVEIIGASTTLEELSLVTEFMPRGSLRKVMDDPDEWEKFTISMSLVLLLDAARGMLYLEEQGVRHRDLKSHNILITSDNHAKLIDFGLSKTCDAITKSTETSAKGIGRGTLPWTAPELFSLEENEAPHQGSMQSDVYSYGVVIWEVLAGVRHRPWRGVPVGVLISSVMAGRKPPLPQDAIIYPELHDLMNKCLEFLPSDRPRFEEVCDVLGGLSEAHLHADDA